MNAKGEIDSLTIAEIRSMNDEELMQVISETGWEAYEDGMGRGFCYGCVASMLVFTIVLIVKVAI